MLHIFVIINRGYLLRVITTVSAGIVKPETFAAEPVLYAISMLGASFHTNGSGEGCSVLETDVL